MGQGWHLELFKEFQWDPGSNDVSEFRRAEENDITSTLKPETHSQVSTERRGQRMVDSKEGNTVIIFSYLRKSV